MNILTLILQGQLGPRDWWDPSKGPATLSELPDLLIKGTVRALENEMLVCILQRGRGSLEEGTVPSASKEVTCVHQDLDPSWEMVQPVEEKTKGVKGVLTSS